MWSSGVESCHVYYRALVCWGKQYPDEMIPWMLTNIDKNWDICFMLWEIVGKEKAPQIPEEFAGHRQFIVDAWLTWGELQGYIIAEPS